MNTYEKNISSDANVSEPLKIIRNAISDIRRQVDEDRSGVWSARSVLDALTVALDAYAAKSSDRQHQL